MGTGLSDITGDITAPDSEEQSDNDDALLLAPLMTKIIDFLAVAAILIVSAAWYALEFLALARMEWPAMGVRIHP